MGVEWQSYAQLITSMSFHLKLRIFEVLKDFPVATDSSRPAGSIGEVMLNLTSPIDPAGRELSGGAWISLKTHKIINFH